MSGLLAGFSTRALLKTVRPTAFHACVCALEAILSVRAALLHVEVEADSLAVLCLARVVDELMRDLRASELFALSFAFSSLAFSLSFSFVAVRVVQLPLEVCVLSFRTFEAICHFRLA